MSSIVSRLSVFGVHNTRRFARVGRLSPPTLQASLPWSKTSSSFRSLRPNALFSTAATIKGRQGLLLRVPASCFRGHFPSNVLPCIRRFSSSSRVEAKIPPIRGMQNLPHKTGGQSIDIVPESVLKDPRVGEVLFYVHNKKYFSRMAAAAFAQAGFWLFMMGFNEMYPVEALEVPDFVPGFATSSIWQVVGFAGATVFIYVANFFARKSVSELALMKDGVTLKLVTHTLLGNKGPPKYISRHDLWLSSSPSKSYMSMRVRGDKAFHLLDVNGYFKDVPQLVKLLNGYMPLDDFLKGTGSKQQKAAEFFKGQSLQRTQLADLRTQRPKKKGKDIFLGRD